MTIEQFVMDTYELTKILIDRFKVPKIILVGRSWGNLIGLVNPFFSIKHLWNDEFYKINLFEQILRIDIPVYFLVGRYDYFTPSKIVEKYYQKLFVPKGKYIMWFEKSGHKPEIEESDKLHDVMINQVL